MKKILLASTSEKKKLRIQKLLQLIDLEYEIILPVDLNIEKIDIGTMFVRCEKFNQGCEGVIKARG